MLASCFSMSNTHRGMGSRTYMPLAVQVNITSRDAATNPGAIDSLSEFAGLYTTVFKGSDDQAPRPVELAIAASKSGEPFPLRNRPELNLFAPHTAMPVLIGLLPGMLRGQRVWARFPCMSTMALDRSEPSLTVLGGLALSSSLH